MTTLNSPVDTSSARFPSFSALRAAHGELLKRYREAPDKSAIFSDIQGFMTKGRKTGVLIDSDDDRLATQSLLDYWLSILLRADQAEIDTTLAEFDINLAPTLADSACPYRGLEAFKEPDAGFFYGRQRLIGQLLETLQARHFLVAIGASGSGKSSVVLSGVIPRLKTGALPDSEHWQYYGAMVPGSNPLENLARLLCPTTTEAAAWRQETVQQLEHHPSRLPDVLHELAGDRPGVLVIDQFEEVFTLCQDKTIRKAFIKSLVAVLESTVAPRHYVVLTMRSDFESQVAKAPHLRLLVEAAQVRVLPLDAGELREAIVKPAEQVGLRFEDGVVDELITDVLGEPAALPLLQFMLLKLWGQREHNRVTNEAYQRLGGGREALANSADEFYNGLIPEDQDTTKRILLKMVRPSTGLEVTSNRIRRHTLDQLGVDPERIARVLDKLLAARLVRLTAGDTPADDQLEVAHEALIRNWPRLIEWLDEDRVTLRQRLHLADTAAEWDRRGKPKEMLLKGYLLEEASQYQDLNPVEQRFVQRGQQLEQFKSTRRFVVIGLLIIFPAISIHLWNELRLSEAKENIAISEQKRQESEIELAGAKAARADAEAKLQDAENKLTEAEAKLAEAEFAKVNAEAAKESAELNLEQIGKIRAQMIEQNRRAAEAADEPADLETAQSLEREAFKALLRGDLKVAADKFGEAYDAFPRYLNVDEIANQVLTAEMLTSYEGKPAAEQKDIYREIFQDILDNYSSGAPPEVISQMLTRLSTEVEYYARPSSTEFRLNERLIAIGFNVIEKSGNNAELNSLWFGEQIDLGTIKLVAIILLEQGVELRAIRPFSEDSKNRASNKIQIGGDAINCSVWTPEAIEGRETFTRGNSGCM
jgi:hypothetical protein